MTIKRWKEWRKVRQLQLLDNMCVRRVYDDPASADRFAAWLLRVGDGRETTVQDTDLIRVPSDMIVHSIAELVNSVFPDLSDNASMSTVPSWRRKTMMLTKSTTLSSTS